MQGFSLFLPHEISLPRVIGLLPQNSYGVSQHIMLKTSCFIENTLIVWAQRQQ